jgi:hypothetical protein
MSKKTIIESPEHFFTVVRAFLPGCYTRFRSSQQTLGRYEGHQAFFGNSSFIGTLLFSTLQLGMVAKIYAHERIRQDLIPPQIFIGNTEEKLVDFLKLYKRHGGFRAYTYEEVKFICDKLKEVEKIDLSAIGPYKKFTT